MPTATENDRMNIRNGSRADPHASDRNELFPAGFGLRFGSMAAFGAGVARGPLWVDADPTAARRFPRFPSFTGS